MAAAMATMPARAQRVQRIAAIVNNEVISTYDLLSRLSMVITSTQLRNSTKERNRIAPQILESLIEERLKIQESKRRNVTASKRDIKEAITMIEVRSNTPVGDFEKLINRGGPEAQTVRERIKADIVWNKLVLRRLRPRVTIGDKEIEAFLNRLKASQGQDEFRLAEILVSFNLPGEEVAAKRRADRLVKDARLKGAKFSALARQFSRSATAAVGGDLGWVRSVELEPETLKIVSTMSKGQVSDPVRTVMGFRIYLLRGKRKFAAKGPSETIVGLKQIFFPLLNNATLDEIGNQTDLANSVRSAVDGCKDMEVIAKEVRSPRSANLGKFAYSDLTPEIRKAIDGLRLGQASEPTKVPGGIVLLMVCERITPQFDLPSRPQVIEDLTNRRLELMARRYLRDLRSAANIDIRI